MSTARDAAEAVVTYDPDVALTLLAHIVGLLDGPSLGDPPDAERARGFLTSRDSRDTERSEELSTREWKVDFARRERMRALGLELAKRL